MRNYKGRIIDRFVNQALSVSAGALEEVQFVKCPRCPLRLYMDNADILSQTIEQHHLIYHSEERRQQRRESVSNVIPKKKRKTVVHVSGESDGGVYVVPATAEPEVHKCDFGGCKYQTQLPSLLKQHYTIHNYEIIFKCGHCNGHYSVGPSKFKNHAKTMHHLDKPEVHVSHDHGRTYKPFSGFDCQVEGCSFYTDLSRLMLRHEGFHERTHHFKCETCCELFTHISSIKKSLHKCEKEGLTFVVLETHDGGDTYHPVNKTNNGDIC